MPSIETSYRNDAVFPFRIKPRSRSIIAHRFFPSIVKFILESHSSPPPFPFPRIVDSLYFDRNGIGKDVFFPRFERRRNEKKNPFLFSIECRPILLYRYIDNCQSGINLGKMLNWPLTIFTFHLWNDLYQSARFEQMRMQFRLMQTLKYSFEYDFNALHCNGW